MKAKLHIVTIDSDNEELIAFAQTIDFDELFKHIKAFLNVDCIFYQPAVITSGNGVYITFASDDIVNSTGPFAAILSRCYIYSFSNGVFRDKETGEPGYWVSVSLRYEHKDGGSNGMEVTLARYHSGEWAFLDAGQKR